MTTTPRIAYGGKNFYGAAVGILMLETQFPRLVGDIGNAETWDFPVLVKTVEGASADLVVNQKAEGLLDAFTDAGMGLVRQGADGITTSCGFMALFQRELADRISVPVATSSLLQVPFVNQLLSKDQCCGIITVKRDALTDAHLQGVGVPLNTPIVGTESGEEFTRAVLGDENQLNVTLAEKDLLNAAKTLVKNYPQVGAIVLECTNMAPYAQAIHRAVHLPVYSVYSLIQWFQAGLQPRRFG